MKKNKKINSSHNEIPGVVKFSSTVCASFLAVTFVAVFVSVLIRNTTSVQKTLVGLCTLGAVVESAHILFIVWVRDEKNNNFFRWVGKIITKATKSVWASMQLRIATTHIAKVPEALLIAGATLYASFSTAHAPTIADSIVVMIYAGICFAGMGISTWEVKKSGTGLFPLIIYLFGGFVTFTNELMPVLYSRLAVEIPDAPPVSLILVVTGGILGIIISFFYTWMDDREKKDDLAMIEHSKLFRLKS